MEGFFKALQQPEYDHVLLNHFPIIGLFVALVFLIATLIMNNRAGQFLSLAMVGLLALSAWPVAHYGEAAYDRVLAMSDEAGGLYLKEHRQLAERWIFLYYVTAAAAAGAMVLGWKRPKRLRAASVVVALLAGASLCAGAVIADAGGKIRHREFRYGPPPASNTEGQAGIASPPIPPEALAGFGSKELSGGILTFQSVWLTPFSGAPCLAVRSVSILCLRTDATRQPFNPDQILRGQRHPGGTGGNVLCRAFADQQMKGGQMRLWTFKA